MLEKIRFSNTSKRSNNSSSSSDSSNENNDSVCIMHISESEDEIGIIITDNTLTEKYVYLTIDNIMLKEEKEIIDLVSNIRILIVLNNLIHQKLINFSIVMEFHELNKFLTSIPLYNVCKYTKNLVKKLNWYTIVQPEINDLVLYTLKEDYIKIDNALYNANTVYKVIKQLLDESKLPEWNIILIESMRKKKIKIFFTSMKRKLANQTLQSNDGNTFSVKSL